MNEILSAINAFFVGLGIDLLALILWGVALIAFFGLLILGFVIFRRTFTSLDEIWKQLRSAIVPKTWDSYQTLVWISVFAWAVSLLTRDFAQFLIACIGWLFLIGGLHWGLHTDKAQKALTINIGISKIFIVPWITGALVSFFLFATPTDIPPIAYVLWPLISATIAATPKFIKTGQDGGPTVAVPAPGVRQNLVILGLVNLLLSCWIQFYFVTQAWLAEYPSLATYPTLEEARRAELDPSSRGVLILEQTEAQLRNQLNGKTWTEVEQWLLDRDRQIPALRAAVWEKLPNVPENDLWDLRERLLSGEYNLQFLAVWQGPTAGARGYYLSKTCQIKEVFRRNPADLRPRATTDPAPKTTATITCSNVQGPTAGEPEG